MGVGAARASLNIVDGESWSAIGNSGSGYPVSEAALSVPGCRTFWCQIDSACKVGKAGDWHGEIRPQLQVQQRLTVQ